MNLSALENAILAQGELGGYELVLNEPLNLSPSPSPHRDREPQAQRTATRESPIPAPPLPPKDEKWQSAATLAEFYAEIEKHPFYQKHASEGKFTTPEFKPSAAYLLILHSPDELTPESQTLLANLFTAISNRSASIFEPQAKKIDLADCAISFLAKIPIKRIMPRELAILQKMLAREITLLNPQKVIFWGTAFRNQASETPFSEIAGVPKTFAGKPSIILYSPLEMLADESLKKETWKVHIPKSGWF